MAEEIAPSALAQQGAELILQDERLTSDLEDAAADVLLRWAIDLARCAVAARARQGLPADRQVVVDTVAPVRQVARAVNDLAAARARMDEHEFVVRLLALVDAARQVDRCQ